MKTLILSVYVLIFCGNLHADSYVPHGSVSTGVASQYLAFGSGAVLYDKPTVQSEFALTWDAGPYIGLWHSSGFDSRWNNNLGDELDYKIGFRKRFFGFDVHAGFMYFDEPNVFTLGSGDIYYSHFSISKDLPAITVTLQYENYITAPGTPFEGGNLLSLGVGRTCPVIKELLSVSGSFALVYDDGGFGLDSGFFHRGNVSFSWKATEKLSFTAPSISFYLPYAVHDSRENEVVVYVGATYKLW